MISKFTVMYGIFTDRREKFCTWYFVNDQNRELILRRAIFELWLEQRMTLSWYKDLL